MSDLNEMVRLFDEADDSAAFDGDHPILRLAIERDGLLERGKAQQSTIDSLRGVQATILKWCEANIEDGTQVTDFCVQVRDLIEKNTTAYWAYQNAPAQSNDTPD